MFGIFCLDFFLTFAMCPTLGLFLSSRATFSVQKVGIFPLHLQSTNFGHPFALSRDVFSRLGILSPFSRSFLPRLGILLPDPAGNLIALSTLWTGFSRQKLDFFTVPRIVQDFRCGMWYEMRDGRFLVQNYTLWRAIWKVFFGKYS